MGFHTYLLYFRFRCTPRHKALVFHVIFSYLFQFYVVTGISATTNVYSNQRNTHNEWNANEWNGEDVEKNTRVREKSIWNWSEL